MGLFLLIDVNIARGSVYWLDGSANYLYPVFMLSWAVYIFDKSLSDNKKHYFLPLLCFFAGATTEQAGLMTAGILFAIVASEKITGRKKLLAPHYAAAACLLGWLTVILAPGTFARHGIERTGFSLERLVKAVNFLFEARSSAPVFVALAISSAAYLLNKTSREYYKNNGRKAIRLVNNCALACLCLTAVFYAAVLAFDLLDTGAGVFTLAVVIPVFLFVSYAFAFYFIVRKNILPLAFFIAAIGAQAIMFVMPEQHRALLCSMLALIVPAVTAVSELINSEIKSHKKFAVIISGALAAAGIAVFAVIFQGYAVNFRANIYNLRAIREFKAAENERESEDGTQILLRALPKEQYGWNPLHRSRYHVLWLERYYKLPADTVFVDFPQSGVSRLFGNGDRRYTNTPPMFIHSAEDNIWACFIGVRDAAAALGYKIGWDEKSSLIIIETTGGEIITVSPDTGEAAVDGTAARSEYAIFNYGGRFMIEADFYREVLGLGVKITQNENGGEDVNLFDFDENYYNRLFAGDRRIHTNAPPFYVVEDNIWTCMIPLRDAVNLLGYDYNISREGLIIIHTGREQIIISRDTGEVAVDGIKARRGYMILNHNGRFMAEPDFYRDIFGISVEITPNELEGADVNLFDLPGYQINRLRVNGEQIHTNSPPFYVVEDNIWTCCVSVRDVADALGYSYTVSMSTSTSTEGDFIIIETGEKTIAVSAVTGEVSVDGADTGFKYMIFDRHGRFMLEADFYRDILGLEIRIVQNAREGANVYITS
jgi:hypothetical protein